MNEGFPATPVLLELGGAVRGQSGGPVRLDPTSPAVSIMDFSVTRGDGVFESIAVFGGRPLALGLHLTRLAQSAVRAELGEIDRNAIEQAVRYALARHPPAELAIVKVLLSRGTDPRSALGGDRSVRAWVYVEPLPDNADARENGLTAITLDRGVDDRAVQIPWLLMGAKTLSYALNMAARREAERRGADHAIFHSSEGYVMEGPNSTVMLFVDGVLTTPDPRFGILRGTTQQEAFFAARELGLPTAYRRVTVDELYRADAVWMAGSGSALVPLVAIDGRSIPINRDLTRSLTNFIRTRRDVLDPVTEFDVLTDSRSETGIELLAYRGAAET